MVRVDLYVRAEARTLQFRDVWLAEVGEVEAAWEAFELALEGFFGFAACVVDGGDDEVLEHFEVGLIAAEAGDGGGVDADLEELLFAVDGGGDGASAAGAIEDGLREAALDFLLHLAGFGEHFLHFEWIEHVATLQGTGIREQQRQRQVQPQIPFGNENKKSKSNGKIKGNGKSKTTSKTTAKTAATAIVG